MKKWRQKLHLEPPDGWLNDPNGLCFFGGKYHVFFQYSPCSAEGRTPRCWGHFEGESLYSMKYTGIALSPDIPEDRNGAYSGSAVEDGGLLHLFYTGNVKEKGDFDYIRSGRGANVIHVTTPDGRKYSSKTTVLRNCDYPDFCTCHVRDPKVWRENGRYKMVLGARTLEDKGCVLIYSSENLEDWDYVTSVSVPDTGYMWECPDYFRLDGRGYLSVSPQGMEHGEARHQNVYSSGYFPVNGALEADSFGGFREWDYGFDFYAPQTFEDENGRRILIGWMGMGDSPYTNLTVPMGWQHCLTLPRELTAGEDGTLRQNPVKETAELFGESRGIINGSPSEVSLPFDLFALTDGAYALDMDGRLRIRYDPSAELFTLEFTDEQYGGRRTVRRLRTAKYRDIRVIADMSSIEIYLNGGEQVMSTRFYPEGESVTLRADGSISAVVSEYKGGGADE